MATFEDNGGNKWHINLCGPTIIEVRKRCDGLDLAAIDGSAFPKLAEDPCLLGTLMWVLCEKQATEQNVNADAFAELIVGDAIDRATDALNQAVLDFSPKRNREVLKALSESSDRRRDRAMKEVLSRVGNKELEDEAIEALKKHLDDEFHKSLTQRFSAINAPAPAESAPTG